MWSHESEFELVCKDGSVIPLLINSTTLTDAEGNFLASRCTVHDISEQKRTEQRLLELNNSLTKRVETEIERRLMNERLLARHARLAAIGEMIGAIAHQWRQPLSTLGAIIQGIRMAWDSRCLDDEFMKSAESDAQMQLYHMSDTIEGFRNFFSPEKVVEYFDIRKIIQEIVPLVHPQFTESGVSFEIIDRSMGNDMTISGYQNEFKQSILNLVSNSLDSITEKRLIRDVPDMSGKVVLSVDCRDGMVIIEVRDNGCGIPPEYAEKVFEPYFTSKSSGKGTGIGLYMSRLIVEESMGGRLSYTSNEGGTIFTITLPKNCSEVSCDE